MTKVLFLTVSGPDIGLGHLIRSQTLALVASKAGLSIDFWVYSEKPLETASPKLAITNITMINGKIPDLLQKLSQFLHEHPTQWLILDGYDFTGRNFFDVCHSHNCQLLAFDDVGGRQLTTDVVLNNSTNNPNYYDSEQIQASHYICSTDYALIPKEYREASYERAFPSQISKILISWGGSDKGKRTLKALEHLSYWPHDLEINVVIGPYSQLTDQELIDASKHPLIIHRNLPNLADLMAKADLMICPPSTTSLQACCVGVPLMVILTVKNQEEVTHSLEMAHAAICLDSSSSVDLPPNPKSPLLKSLKNLDSDKRKALSKNSRHLIDGLGAERIVDLLNKHKILSCSK